MSCGLHSLLLCLNVAYLVAGAIAVDVLGKGESLYCFGRVPQGSSLEKVSRFER